MSEMVRLVTSDDEVVEVEKDVAKKCMLLKGQIEDNEDNEEDIPLPHVNKAILEKIIVYCKYINENALPVIPKPLPANKELSDVVDPWYADYINVEKKLLQDLMIATNFLDIPSLMDLAAAKYSTNIRGKTVEEIRAEFDIEQDDVDFTPEEEAQIKEENEIAMESF